MFAAHRYLFRAERKTFDGDCVSGKLQFVDIRDASIKKKRGLGAKVLTAMGKAEEGLEVSS
jgi:hypothetical protein